MTGGGGLVAGLLCCGCEAGGGVCCLVGVVDELACWWRGQWGREVAAPMVAVWWVSLVVKW